MGFQYFSWISLRNFSRRFSQFLLVFSFYLLLGLLLQLFFEISQFLSGFLPKFVTSISNKSLRSYSEDFTCTLSDISWEISYKEFWKLSPEIFRDEHIEKIPATFKGIPELASRILEYLRVRALGKTLGITPKKSEKSLRWLTATNCKQLRKKSWKKSLNKKLEELYEKYQQ